jgi:hypothetical protein
MGRPFTPIRPEHIAALAAVSNHNPNRGEGIENEGNEQAGGGFFGAEVNDNFEVVEDHQTDGGNQEQGGGQVRMTRSPRAPRRTIRRPFFHF